jgi:hypothetical protein
MTLGFSAEVSVFPTVGRDKDKDIPEERDKKYLK